jgi:HEAT repeat protein
MKSRYVRLLLVFMLPGIACVAVAEPPPSAGPDTVLYQGKSLDFWVRQLKDDEALAREEAVAVLSDAGPDAASALPAIKDLLKDPSANLRLQAAVAVWKIGRQGDAAATVLIAALKSPNRANRLLALQILARIGAGEKEVLPAVMTVLADPDAVVRQRAFEALEQIGPAAVPGLVERLRDGDPGVRRECTACLGRIGAGDNDISARLTDALKDDDKQVRVAATEALLRTEHKNKDAIAVLIDGVMDEDADVRRSAGELLLQVRPRPKEAAPAYAALLKPENNVNLRLGAADALWELHRRSKEVLPVLLEIVKSPDWNGRQRAFEIMVRLGSGAKPALPDLIVLVKSGQQPGYIEDVFVQIGSDAVPPLVEILHQNNPTAYRAAAILGHMGPEAGPTLLKLLDDSDAQIRSKAISILRENGPSVLGDLSGLIPASPGEKEVQQYLLAVNGIGWSGPDAKAAVPLLLDMASKKDSSYKRTALDALFAFRLDANKVLPILNELVNDKDPSVCLAAAILRWRLDHKAGPAVEIIKPLLSNPVCRSSVIKTLVDISAADPEGVSALVSCIEDPGAGVDWQTLSVIEQAGVTPKLPIAPLAKKLHSKETYVRYAAACLLARLGADAKLVVPVLIDGLKAPGPVRGRQNLRALSLYGEEAASAGPSIKALLDDRDIFTIMEAAQALVRIQPAAKKEAMDALLRALAEPEKRPYGIEAAGTLLQLDALNPKAIAALKKALTDPDPQVRNSALTACYTAGPDAKPLLPLLEKALDEETGELRLWAAVAYWKVGGQPDKAAAVLAESLKESPHTPVRMSAARLLGMLGVDARTAVPILCDALKDRSLQVRKVAADSLREIGPAAAEKAGIPLYPMYYP